MGKHVALTERASTLRGEETWRHCMPADAPVSVLGPAVDWFTIKRDGTGLWITPKAPLARRCVIRPVARFRQARGFPDVNTVMGRLLFRTGAVESQRYEPFTLDQDRSLRELMLLTEISPDDELFSSPTRWRNAEAVARRLLSAADVPWSGLSDRDVAELVAGEPWFLPLEGCVLHALARWTHGRGDAVIEIGSYRGQSLAMLARGLRAAESAAPLFSVDPHGDRPEHRSYVRLALAVIGEDGRLVQIHSGSDEAARVFRPGSVSLVFIDGDHAHDQVLRDFHNYAPLLAPGGCLVFHDYGYGPHNGRPDVVPDVRRVVDEHVMTSDAFSPLLLAHTLMVFRKRT